VAAVLFEINSKKKTERLEQGEKWLKENDTSPPTCEAAAAGGGGISVNTKNRCHGHAEKSGRGALHHGHATEVLFRFKKNSLGGVTGRAE